MLLQYTSKHRHCNEKRFHSLSCFCRCAALRNHAVAMQGLTSPGFAFAIQINAVQYYAFAVSYQASQCDTLPLHSVQCRAAPTPRITLPRFTMPSPRSARQAMHIHCDSHQSNSPRGRAPRGLPLPLLVSLPIIAIAIRNTTKRSHAFSRPSNSNPLPVEPMPRQASLCDSLPFHNYSSQFYSFAQSSTAGHFPCVAIRFYTTPSPRILCPRLSKASQRQANAFLNSS